MKNTEKSVGIPAAHQRWFVYLATHPSLQKPYLGATYTDLNRYNTGSGEILALIDDTEIKPTFTILATGVSDRNDEIECQLPYVLERRYWDEQTALGNTFSNRHKPIGSLPSAHLPTARAFGERARDSKTGIHAQSDEERAEASRKGNKAAMRNKTNNFTFDLITCECGLQGNRPNMNRHANSKGHTLNT
jgi:hypothetical protein